MSRRQLLAAALIVLAPAFGGCSTGAGSDSGRAAAQQKAMAALRAADSSFTAAVVAKDPERTAAMYMADATLLPIAEPIITGRDAIRQEWAKTFGIPGFENRVRATRFDVAASGDLAFTQGTYESAMTGADGRPTVERGKWVTVWRRDSEGNWRVTTDIANTDTPPPEHQESTAHSESARPGG